MKNTYRITDSENLPSLLRVAVDGDTKKAYKVTPDGEKEVGFNPSMLTRLKSNQRFIDKETYDEFTKLLTDGTEEKTVYYYFPDKAYLKKKVFQKGGDFKLYIFTGHTWGELPAYDFDEWADGGECGFVTVTERQINETLENGRIKDFGKFTLDLRLDYALKLPRTEF